MTNNFITYVAQDRITSWKVLALHEKDRDIWPFAYGFDTEWFYQQLKTNDIIWVISAPNILVGKGQYRRLPPMLVAKIVVAQKRRYSSPHENKPFPRNYKFAAIANKNGSRFFPANDAFKALVNTTFTNKREKQWDLKDKIRGLPTKTPEQRAKAWIKRCAIRFQSARKIALSTAGVANHLCELADSMKKHTIFISYRHVDHEDNWNRPLDLVQSLISHGFAPWFDRTTIPSSKALLEASKEGKALTSLLNHGLKTSDALLAIVTKNYGGKSISAYKSGIESYTLYEWNQKPLHYAWFYNDTVKRSALKLKENSYYKTKSIAVIVRKFNEWMSKSS